MRMKIEHCRIVSPGMDIPDGNLLLEDDRILAVGDPGEGNFDCDITIDGKGLIAAPGFIDIHTHGRSNSDFCDGTAEAFRVIGKGKLEDGVTGFLATTLTLPVEELRNVCAEAERYKNDPDSGAQLLGIHLEGPCFNQKCAGAQNPAYLRDPEWELIEEFDRISKVVKVSFSPELPGAVEFTRALSAHGIMPSGGHTEADYDRFEACRAAGMKHLTHFCNVMTPLHHLRFGMVGAGLLDDDVFVEMICDGVHLCDQMIRLIARCKGPERMMLITDSIRAAAMPDGNYSLGGLPVIVKNGRATLTTGPVAGSTLRYHNGLRHLIRITGMPLSQAIAATSFNQASSLNLGLRGKLIPGWLADIVLLDQELIPQVTICAGSVRWQKEPGRFVK